MGRECQISSSARSIARDASGESDVGPQRDEQSLCDFHRTDFVGDVAACQGVGQLVGEFHRLDQLELRPRASLVGHGARVRSRRLSGGERGRVGVDRRDLRRKRVLHGGGVGKRQRIVQFDGQRVGDHADAVDLA